MSKSDRHEANGAGPLLEARELHCERDERLLFTDLSFTLSAGSALQIAGSNGSGKTTLLRILCGLNDGYSGDLRWRGLDCRQNVDPFVADLLYLGHRVGVNKVLSPLENLRWSSGLQARVDDGALRTALADVGLAGFEESPCHTLSAGQQQRSPSPQSSDAVDPRRAVHDARRRGRRAARAYARGAR
jgi:heme exporter protein A